MESKGWIFSWNDQYVFRPEQQKTFCSDVPLTSYCGFQFPGDGEISYKFSSSGTANLTYGNSMNGGWIRIYLNNKEISSRNPKGTSNVEFDYSEGDVLSIRERLGLSVSLTKAQVGKIFPMPQSSRSEKIVVQTVIFSGSSSSI